MEQAAGEESLLARVGARAVHTWGVTLGLWATLFSAVKSNLAPGEGASEVESTGLLRKRVHEINVMAALDARGVADSRIYLLSTANAARATAFLLKPCRKQLVLALAE